MGLVPKIINILVRYLQSLLLLSRELIRTETGLFGAESVTWVALSGITETSTSRVALVAVRITSCTTQQQTTVSISNHVYTQQVVWGPVRCTGTTYSCTGAMVSMSDLPYTVTSSFHGLAWPAMGLVVSPSLVQRPGTVYRLIFATCLRYQFLQPTQDWIVHQGILHEIIAPSW